MPYDLIILGGGPAGYHAAARAARAGLSVLLAEKGEIGGVCLNEGCIPTKTLLNSAKYYDMAKNGAAFGVTASGVTYNQSAVITRKNRVVKKLGIVRFMTLLTTTFTPTWFSCAYRFFEKIARRRFARITAVFAQSRF